MQDDEELLFIDEPDIEELLPNASWKLLVVDDEQSVHDVTKLALKDFVYARKNLTIIHAYSATEAAKTLVQHPDIAVILLDVVMEHDQAGLDLVKYIRNELCNPFVRIILRTGQPGQAPEQEVIINYDINDYKEKTELTLKKLFTTLVTALRTYHHLMQMNRNRLGLEKVIDATASLFQLKSLGQFTSGLLEQLLSILNLDSNAFYSHTLKQMGNDDIKLWRHIILAGTGIYASKENQLVEELVDSNIHKKIAQAELAHQTMYFDHECVIYFKYNHERQSFVYIDGFSQLDAIDKDLIEHFCNNMTIAYETLFSSQKARLIE